MTTLPKVRSVTGPPDFHRDRRRWRILILVAVAGAVLALVAWVATTLFIGPSLRSEIEGRLNANLKGYTAHLAALEFHPVGFSITLEGLVIRQDQHPKPAVVEISRFDAGVQWQELLQLRLVADMRIVQLKVHVDRSQYESEARDATSIEDRGWQTALESIYPLNINEIRVENGELTYIDGPAEPPVYLTNVDIVARNIRNVRDAGADYPSEILVAATVFDSGSLKIDGHADFLREPYAGVTADLSLEGVPLEKIRPVSNNVNLWITGGVLSAQGHVLYAPTVKVVRLKQATLRGMSIDYVHSPKTLDSEAERMRRVQAAVGEITSTPETTVLVDAFHIRESSFGYVDQTTTPPYRLVLADADASLTNFSNQPGAPSSVVTLNGKFMGVGKTTATATFQPMATSAELDVELAIEATPLTAMNDVLRAYGNFDVVAGSFAFYSKLALHAGRIEGWVKPLFRQMKVYSAEQDAEKGVPNRLYENVLDGVRFIFENSRDTVATETTISGKIENPRASTWGIFINLAVNAFFKAIVPGFESQLGHQRGADSPQDR